MLLTATGLLNQVLGFFYRILLSRLVGAEIMGLYQLVMPVYSVLLSVTAVGLTAAVSNLTSEYRALGNWAAAGQVLRRCLVLLVALLILPALVVVLFSDPISVYLLGDARTQLGLLLLLPCILLTGVENLHKHAFYGAGMIRPPAFTELLEQVVRTCAVLGLLVAFLPQNPERTVGLIVTGMVLCEVFSACTLTLLHRRYRRGLSGPRGPGVPPRELDRRIARIALPIAATSLLGNLMGSVCAILIPQKLVAGGMEVSAAVSAFGVMFGMSIPMLNLPTAFIAACNKFKYLEVLQQEGEEEAAAECQERKCAEKSEGAAPSTAQTSLREIRRAVRTIIDDSSEDDDQWVPLSTVGNTLIKRFPEFDVRNYGHRKLTSFVKSLDAFEVREVPNPTDDNTKKIYVRTRPGNRNNKKNR